MARSLMRLAICVAVTAAAAAIGALGSADAASFYTSLQLPAWAPPPKLFGPVWSVLYLLMAIAWWRTWQAPGDEKSGEANAFYLVQLAVNGLWSWAFFHFRWGGAAFVVIVVLWLLIAATIRAFARRDKLAAWLLSPYLAWVSFAAVLNFAVWRLNPAALGG